MDIKMYKGEGVVKKLIIIQLSFEGNKALTVDENLYKTMLEIKINYF